MRKKLVVFAVLAATASPAFAIPVSSFIARAEALQKKGMLALFSSDLKPLRDQALSDLRQIGAERRAAKAAGRPTSFCPPEGGVKMTDQDVLGAMQAIPPPLRDRTDTKDAFRAYLARRFPCRA